MSTQSYEIEGLSVSFPQGQDRRTVVGGVSFTLEPGRVVALVGESGSGKSVVARSLLGLAGTNAHVSAERFALNGTDVSHLSDREWRAVRGRDIGFVPQDALVSLDPFRTIGREVAQSLEAHRWGDKASRAERVIESLRQSGMPDPVYSARQRSGALSGGLRQRALIAAAIAMDPPFLIADEPTTALDPTVQVQILRLLETLRQRGKGILLISHDLGFVARMADEILVMHKGVVVERSDARTILNSPAHPYTKSLMELHASETAFRSPSAKPDGAAQPLITVNNVSRTFTGPGGEERKAVNRVSFNLHRGEALGLIGESGSGKSTIARIISGFIRPTQGSVLLKGLEWNTVSDTTPFNRADRSGLREIGIIYQDALSSFDPRWTVGRILEDARKTISRDKDDGSTVTELLRMVRLDPDLAERHPLRLSGGQRQRVAIARALATKPSILICDEPVSALDVSVQAQVLDLLAALQAELDLSLLMITHDMSVVRKICSRVVVLKEGRIVEEGVVSDVFDRPKHIFTRQMIDSANFLSGNYPAASNKEAQRWVPAEDEMTP